MQYRKDRKGTDLSILGYGCMRFTKKGSQIDLEKAEAEAERLRGCFGPPFPLAAPPRFAMARGSRLPLRGRYGAASAFIG